MVLLLAIAAMLFEIPSLFYWLSGSMTYLFSFILFVGLVTILLGAAGGKGRMGAGNLVLCLLLTVCIAGSNEIALYFLVIMLLWGQGVHYSVVGKWYRPINWLLATVLLCLLLIIVPGGTAHRAGNFKMNFSVVTGLFVALEYTVRIFFRAASAPLGWLCLALAYLAGTMGRRDGGGAKDAGNANDAGSALAGSIFFNPKIIASIILAAVFVFYFLVYVFSAELLPPRANNLLLCFVFFFLLAVCYSYGIRVRTRRGSGLVLVRSLSGQAIVRVFVFLLLITNSLLFTALQNVVSGSVYKRVMSNREKEIGDAKRAGNHRVMLNRYEKDFDSIGAKTLPGFLRGRFAGMDGAEGQGGRKGQAGGKWSDHPELIHYQDPLADTGLYIHYYAEYHHIDTISYGGIDYPRIGLMEKTQ